MWHETELATLEEGGGLNSEGWLDLRSLREVEFWVSHPLW